MDTLILANAMLFLSTLSLRRATKLVKTNTCKHLISIHALLAESDKPWRKYHTADRAFLSTLSLRRATIHYDNYNLHCVISIHALLAESDPMDEPQYQILDISIHALLAESDLEQSASYNAYLEISIHALLAESDT